MLLPTLLAGLAAGQAPLPEPTVMSLRERAPLAFVLNTPSGEQGRLRVSEILDALGGPLDRHTDLALTPVEPTAVAECEGALACLARRVPRQSQLLLVLSYFAASGDRPDRVSALLLDVASADACVSDPFGTERVDDCISERAVKVRPPPENLANAEEAKAVLAKLVQDDLRPAFEAKSHWEPHGQVRVEEVPSGAALIIDEITVGVAPGGPILVTGLSLGTHDVSYAVAGAVQTGAQVEVARGATATVRLTVDITGFKTPLLLSGIGVAAVGTGFTLWSLIYAAGQSGMVVNCGDGSCGSSFYTIERQARGDIELFEEDPNRGSVLGLPLGYSLLITGATWALGSQLVEDDPVMHWILVGAGVLAGGLAYGISAAANGP